MASCAACKEPLTVAVEPDSDDDGDNRLERMTCSSSTAVIAETVPDDVELPCGCHFHWFAVQNLEMGSDCMVTKLSRECLLDAYTHTECPNCSRSLTGWSTSGEQQLLCNITNEGGFQPGLDILPLLTEETYLKVYPEERRCRAFLEFCLQGDLAAFASVVEQHQTQHDDDSPTTNRDILRYQDSMGGMSSGLHIAILAQQVRVVWMLLLLASNLDLDQFPPEIHQFAEQLEVVRKDQAGKVDIRCLRDTEGRTAEQLAISMGGIWNDWVRMGRFSA